MSKQIIFTLFSLTLACSLGAKAQEVNFSDLTLEDLLNIKTSVSTRTEMTPRNAPGSVTVVTSDEISNSGARDLMDVLMLVPGISFGNDSFGAASLGMRGMWANEGKVLVLYDGLEMNEILFSTVQFGNRYPVDQIKRVEIIRGPGSAIYGGFAELAVINIISKDGESLNGCQVSGKYGQMTHTWARRNLSAACGKKVNGVDVNIAAFSGQGHRSDRMFTGYSGEPVDTDPTNDSSTKTETERFSGNRLDPMFINFGLSSQNMRFRYIREFYEMTTTSGYGYLNSRRPVFSQFYGQYLGLEYDIKPSEKFKITPFAQYKTQKPWQTVDAEIAADVVSNFTADRLKAGVTGSYDLSPQSNILLGYTRTQDWGKNENFQSYQATFQPDGSRREYSMDSVLAQGQIDLGVLNLTVGGRYDKHESVDGAYSPRLAITRSQANYHMKATASQAFRAPTIMDLDSNTNLKPDRTTTYEVEGGYRTTSNTYLTANLFKTEIKDPIIYGVDASGATRKFNEDRTGTYGAELEYRLKDKFGYATLTYSYYKADGKNPSVFRVDGHDDVLLGFPGHKITLNSSFNVGSTGFKINPSATYMTPYYAYNWDAGAGVRYTEKLSPDPLVNVFFLYENLGMKGVNVGAGVFNIIDSDWRLAQPYQSGNHAPLPTESREVVVRADYNVTF